MVIKKLPILRPTRDFQDFDLPPPSMPSGVVSEREGPPVYNPYRPTPEEVTGYGPGVTPPSPFAGAQARAEVGPPIYPRPKTPMEVAFPRGLFPSLPRTLEEIPRGYEETTRQFKEMAPWAQPVAEAYKKWEETPIGQAAYTVSMVVPEFAGVKALQTAAKILSKDIISNLDRVATAIAKDPALLEGHLSAIGTSPLKAKQKVAAAAYLKEKVAALTAKVEVPAKALIPEVEMPKLVKPKEYYVATQAPTRIGSITGEPPSTPIFQQVKGRSVKIPGLEEYDFFVTRDIDYPSLWSLNEGSSGMAIVARRTQAETIKAAQERLGLAGREELNRRVLQAIDRGLSPRYEMPKALPPTAVPKELWQMTVNEYKQTVVPTLKGEKLTQAAFTQDGMGRPFAHRTAVLEALMGGKPVPPEVLAEYPGLVKAVQAIELGDFIRAKGTAQTGIVTGEGTIGKGIPVWKVQGPKGETSAIIKDQAELIAKEKPVPPFFEAPPPTPEAPAAVRPPPAEVAGAKQMEEAAAFKAWQAERARPPVEVPPAEAPPPPVSEEVAAAWAKETKAMEQVPLKLDTLESVKDAGQKAIKQRVRKAGLPPPGDLPPGVTVSPGAGGDGPARVLGESIAIPGENVARAALRKWIGKRDVGGEETLTWWKQGQASLAKIGVGKKVAGRQAVTQPDAEGLFKALHGEGDVPAQLKTVYDDIRKLVQQESADMLAFDPDFAKVMMAHPDYFPRGWRAPKETRLGAARMGAKPGFLKPRIDATFTEMIEAGWEPISWNPYDMMFLRRLAGIEHRESLLLIDRLKEFNQALPVRQALEGWRVPRVGPAFEGKPFVLKDGGVMFTSPIAVLARVADVLEGAYGLKPKMTLAGIDVTNLARQAATGVKRFKLFGSLFQHIDFATRAGGIAFTPTMLMRGGPLRYPSLVARIANVSLRAAPREALSAKILSNEPLYKNSAISLRMIAEEGWQIGGDPSILQRNMMSAIKEEIASAPANKNILRVAADRLDSIPRFFEDGLFRGVYRETQSWALENFIVPKLRKMHPDWADRQIAGSAAEEVNKMFSALGEWQTIFQQPAMRDFSRMMIFSTNESEAWIRQGLSLVTGQNKKLWQEYYLGYMLFLAGVGNAVNYISMGEFLPPEAYSPITLGSRYSFLPWGVAYNTRFMAPQLPFLGKEGRPLYLDLVGQADTFIRWILDAPSAAGSRLNVIPRAIYNQIKGESFWGKPIDRFPDRVAQAAIDLLMPIGASNIFEMARQTISGAEKILPEGERRLGAIGSAIQATGLNVRAAANMELLDAIAKEAGYTRWDDLTAKEQASLRKADPRVGAIAKEATERFTGIINITRALEAGDAVQGRLPENLRVQLDVLGVEVGAISRTIEVKGEGWYLNDARYSRYQDLILQDISKRLGAVGPLWETLSDKKKAELWEERISDAKRWARETLIKEEKGGKALMAPVSTPSVVPKTRPRTLQEFVAPEAVPEAMPSPAPATRPRNLQEFLSR